MRVVRWYWGLMGAALLLWAAAPLRAETVVVKYRGSVDLKPFACTDITQSSFIRRVCFDKANEYMLISLNGTYYHYCEIGSGDGNGVARC